MKVNHQDEVMRVSISSGCAFDFLYFQIDSFSKGIRYMIFKLGFNSIPMLREHVNKTLNLFNSTIPSHIYPLV